MKHITFFFILIFLGTSTGCKKSYYLRGYFTKEEFMDQCRWKKPVNEKYKPELIYMDSLKSVRDSVDLKLFVGTWCSDSRKWVARFFKIQPDLPIRKIEIISVDTSKTDEKGLNKIWRADSLPTFIFLCGDKEIGRIVEKPHKKKLERHLWRILKPQTVKR